MSRTIDGCQVEVDDARGVIYVHGPQGRTLIRICQATILECARVVDGSDDRVMHELLDITAHLPTFH